MSGASAIRGHRIGAGPAGENERGDSAPRRSTEYHCANGHTTQVAFALDAAVPVTWDCPRCGLPAGQEASTPPNAPHTQPFKTHFAYVQERRSEADAAALLDEALARVKARRGEK